MPYAKNTPGQWRNPRRLGGRISQIFCPVCQQRLHEELVAAGIRTHPTCDPEGQ